MFKVGRCMIYSMLNFIFDKEDGTFLKKIKDAHLKNTSSDMRMPSDL